LRHCKLTDMTTRRFDHIDLRVRDMEEVRAFYEALLPALGFVQDAKVEGWLQYDALGEDGSLREFFGVTESPGHVANENRIAFWAESNAEVDRLASIVVNAGAKTVEGPGFEAPGYYAVFFEDASGNRFEICHRTS
jgi:catechol 2,3-dioxygenase-like lactoylglutathione lyase family enzyme